MQQVHLFCLFICFISIQSACSYIISTCNRSLKVNHNQRYRCSDSIAIASSTSTSNSDAPTKIESIPFKGSGCILISSPNEYSHFLMKAAVLIYNHDNNTGSQGVILDRPTAFTMGETSPSIGVFEGNTLYMGGEDGEDMALMFHTYDLNGFSKYIGSGLYTGGLRDARKLVEDRKAHPRDFKFIFNNVEWGPKLLEQEIKEGRWEVVAVPTELVLKQTADQTLWNHVRRHLQLNNKAATNK